MPITDPSTGMTFLTMTEIVEVGGLISAAGVTEAEAREGQTWAEATGQPPPVELATD